jgi:demethoxyubiquinone hydroxylase (CLK1/Coq7/Cat5 family)
MNLAMQIEEVMERYIKNHWEQMLKVLPDNPQPLLSLVLLIVIKMRTKKVFLSFVMIDNIYLYLYVV